MTARTGQGTAMQAHKVYWRIVPKHTRGPTEGANLEGRVVEVRRLLRTNLPITSIAAELGVGVGSLRNFIRRRRLCDLKNRRYFITLQASIATAERKAAQPVKPQGANA